MSIVFFDGVCNLCNGFADFIIRHDREHVFRISSLQGETAKALLPTTLLNSLNTVVLFDRGEIYTESAAVLKVFARLPGAYKWLAYFESLPGPLRNLLYRFVASRRYMLFGQRQSCRLPTAAETAYFLP